MSKLNITDLLTSLTPATKSSNQGRGKKAPTNSQQVQIPKFVENVVKDKQKKITVLTKKQEQQMKRESNYQMAKEEMDKWVGIVKLNREKQSLNFVQKDIGNLNVNFFKEQPMNQFQKKIQSKLQNMNVQSQKAVLKHQDTVLEKVDPQQAKRRLNQARKHSFALFYQEQKRKRIAKIKSKLYHKIKKRQKLRQQAKKVNQMSAAQKNNYIQKLTKQRIKQRITLRHSAKNKHIQNLLRFNRNQKNAIQKQINQVNEIRHNRLQRLNQEMMEQVSEEYDDENFKDQAMKDLEREIQAIEAQQGQNQGEGDEIDEKVRDLKFIQNAKEKRLNKQKEDAVRILSKLKKGKQLKQHDVNSEMDSQQQAENLSQQDQNDDENSSQEDNAQRKVYGKKIKQDEYQLFNPHSAKQKPKNIQSQLKNYLLGGQNDQKQNNEQLVKGIDLQNLRSKYQPQRVPLDLTSLIAQNKQIYENQANQAVLENVRQFQQEKFAQIQQQFNKNQSLNKSKSIKGWGSWAGPGIREKKSDPQQQLAKKIKAIQQLKSKRKDNALAHVTITQTRNKNLSQYFVRKLPHNYANADQFDFMQSEPLGPEWNSLNQFKDNIKPKVITKAGQVILPAKLPRKIEKEAKGK